MDFYDLVGLRLREPLARRPLRGSLYGGLWGAMWGVMSLYNHTGSAASLFLRHALGFSLAGAVVGLLLPSFRSRFLAGPVVSVAAFLGFSIAKGWSNPAWTAPWLAMAAAFTGLLYATALWKYDPNAPTGSRQDVAPTSEGRAV